MNLQGSNLTVTREHQSGVDRKEGEYLYPEFLQARFQRTIRLPEGVETDKLRTEYNNGVLEIIAPIKESALPKRIRINSAEAGDGKSSSQLEAKQAESKKEGITMGHTPGINIKPTRAAVHDGPMSISNAFEEANAWMETVARRAFEIFQERGRGNGSALDDWYRAEAEVLHEMHIHVAESDDAIVIWAEVPGFSAEQLEISVEPKRLAIRGRRIKNHTSEKIIYCEACADRIFRTVSLPVEIDPERATAGLKDGILEVSMPKAKSYVMVATPACSIVRAEDCRVWTESFFRL